MHLIVPDPKGPIRSGKPNGATMLEAAMAKAPGKLSGQFGHPGNRYKVLCKPTARFLTKRNRGTVTPEMITCPQCLELYRAQVRTDVGRPD